MQAQHERTTGTLGMLLRRIAAFTYDTLLIIALFFVIGLAAVALNDGQSVQSIGFYLLLWLTAGAFLVTFWVNGRTLGMQAWRLRIVTPEAAARGSTEAPKASALVARYALGTALFGITLAWMCVDRDRLALHDRLSGTRIVRGSG